VTEGESPLATNGLPFEFESFELQGRVISEPQMFSASETGASVEVDWRHGVLSASHEMPLDLDVVAFPSPQ
jgi:hypothetical protein